MTGPEHFQEAERLAELIHGRPLSPEDTIALGQMHATLALAAAVLRGAS